MSDQKAITLEELKYSSIDVKISVLENKYLKNELKFQVLETLYIKHTEIVNIDKLDCDILKSIDSKTNESQRGIIRKAICFELNIPRTTIYDRLKKLRLRQIIDKFTLSNGKRGRPNTLWYLTTEWASSLLNKKLFYESMKMIKEQDLKRYDRYRKKPKQ